jgi:hypothetical protein
MLPAAATAALSNFCTLTLINSDQRKHNEVRGCRYALRTLVDGRAAPRFGQGEAAM